MSRQPNPRTGKYDPPKPSDADRESTLDEAIEESFPASDPPAPAVNPTPPARSDDPDDRRR